MKSQHQEISHGTDNETCKSIRIRLNVVYFFPVDQIKKESEPAPEAIKQEEKEAAKTTQQSTTTKGPPEKRMRLQ